MEEETQDTEKSLDRSNAERPVNSRKVFVVHGHDHGSKETVARFLAKLDLDPIILHEQADKGRTVIEKFEDYSDVQCAVVILSPDDIAYAKSDPAKQEERARQNVILELGYFIGRLGRDRTFALLLNGVSQPSDLGGILYISMSDGSWRMKLVRELKEAGIEVDANKAI
jgi:predicted nucleotide-binding protein